MPQLTKKGPSKAASGEETDGYIAVAKPVKYTFSLNKKGFKGEARYTEKLVLEDILPTYIDKNGDTQTAKIAPSSKADWKLSADGSKAVYTKGTNWSTRYFENY